ncbi:aldose epimerase family protein, partial [Listeria monocytogenes]|uniref:aldose epimerase family protein n=1 Tax=Listeria monocytogenes TaxID=1639 RepID=UPI003FA4A794
LHGWAWQRPWTVALVSSDRAVLTLEQAAGEWPWSWRAEQHFAVRPDGLRIELKLYNIDRRPMPAGVGLHPYFPATASTRLKAD